MICSICQSLLTAENAPAITGPYGRAIPHHRTYVTFKHSVERGCYVCNRLWATLARDERHFVAASCDSELRNSSDETRVDTDSARADPAEKFITASSLYDGRPYGHPGCYLLELAFNASRVVALEKAQDRTLWRASLLLQPHDGSVTSNMTKELSLYTKSAETLSLARRWITDCVANHQHCNAVARGKRCHPTRLLDYGLLRGSDMHCRLIESNTTVIDGPYMTLSHCWGIADCLKLTTDNYNQLLGGIPLSSLPELYQDAVYTARQLDIRYLWIDALCIIQQGDDLADWRREVTLMSDVYSNSFCNISAAESPDGHHSMFYSRNPEALYPEVVRLCINSRNTPHLISDIRFWDTDVSHAVINTRAWVLQERLLSPRVLHFGVSQVFWECREKDAAEIYPDGLPTGLFPPHKRFKRIAPDRWQESETCSKFWAYQAWSRIVRAYTACALTFPSDKLVALSAVAKMMRAILCDEYVAGMWRCYLERELLWSAVGKRSNNPPRRKTYIAPSWSWAAVDGEINPGLLEVEAEDVLIKVEGVQLEYMQDDNTGSIKEGWLRLRGVLKQLVLVPYRSSATHSYGDWIMVVNGVHVSIPADSSMREPQPHVKLDNFHTDFDKQNAEATLYCMPGRKRKGDDGSIYILLLKLEDRERGIFRRIGLAHRGDVLRERILGRSGEEDKYPCEEYWNGWHSIRII